MPSTKNVLIIALAVAPFAFGAAHASDPDEYTLQPLGVSSTTTTIYAPATNTGGTIITQPTVGQDGQWTNVDINDYIVEDSTTNSQ